MSFARTLARSWAAAWGLAASVALANPTPGLQFVPATITAGNSAVLMLQIFDDGLGIIAGTLAAGAMATTPGLAYGATPLLFNNCAGTIGTGATPDQLSIAGLVVAPSGSCTIQLQVTAAVPGVYSATIPAGGFTTATTSNIFTASATLGVTPPLVVTNVADSGPGSLRQVLSDAAAFCGGGATISFNIPTAAPGPHVIAPATQLPALSCPATFLDGYSQPLSQFNTMLDGTNSAQLQVEIDGSACAACNGITVANGSMVRGLAIYSFAGAQVRASSPGYVYGNYLGVDSSGAVHGGTDGVVAASGSVQVGDGGSANLNLITGMTHAGIWATSASSGLQVTRNQIGGTRAGTAGAGNGVGILVDVGQSQINQNFIRYNGGAGIVIPASNFSRNLFTSNLAYANGGPGIDLNDDGPTPNDEASVPYDSDVGPNQLVNYPVITSVVHVGSDTQIDGYLKSAANASSTIELYHSSSVPPAGATQGERWIDSFPLTLDATGFATFTSTINGFLADNVSAIATTDTCNDGCVYTSEYSPSVAAGGPPSTHVSFTPSSLVFAPRTVGTSSTAQTVTLTNTGTNPLSIYSLGIMGDFSFTSPCTATLAAGGSCDIDIVFTPVVAGARAGVFSMSTDDPASPHAIALSGTGLLNAAPVLDISPALLDFAPQAAGTQSDLQLVVVINAGTATLQLDAAAVTDGFILLPDTGASTYQLCGASLEPGSVCAYAIAFVPASAQPYDGRLTVFTNTAGSPTQVRLLGTGIVGVPARTLTVAPLLAFGSIPVGTRSAGLALPITNNGAGPASITGLSASGDFTVSDTCATIAAHSTCSPLVFFQPSATGDRSGTLTIHALSEATPYGVALTGTGTFNPVPQISLSVTHVGFGNTLLGVPSASAQVLVRNVGQVPVTIEGFIASGDYLVAHACGITIAVGATCTLNVSFYPRMTGSSVGGVEIRTNAAGSPHQVQFSGVGCALPTVTRARGAQLVCGA